MQSNGPADALSQPSPGGRGPEQPQARSDHAHHAPDDGGLVARALAASQGRQGAGDDKTSQEFITHTPDHGSLVARALAAGQGRQEASEDKTWQEFIIRQRQENQGSGGNQDSNEQARGRSLPDEQKEKDQSRGR